LAEEERIITVPLADAMKAPRTRRAERAIKAIKEHVTRHMKAKTEDVWVDPKINEAIWSRGIQKPPKRIRVRAIKFEDELVEVSLPEE